MAGRWPEGSGRVEARRSDTASFRDGSGRWAIRGGSYDDASRLHGVHRRREWLWAAYEASRNFIGNAKPCALEGVLAKARAAKAEAGSMGEVWAWDIVDDLLAVKPLA